MRVGILGASGALGRKTLAAVVDRGFDPLNVVAAARSPDKLRNWRKRGVDVRHADYDQPDSLKDAFSGIDRLLLVPSTAPPAARCQQYENAINAARGANVPHVLHYGIVGTRLESRSMLMPFLLFAESAVRTSGLDWTVLRNDLYADPIADWVPSIVEMGTIPYPTGEGRCAFVSRDDIARTGAAVLTTDGHETTTYHLTGPAALTTADLCEIVSRVTGEPVEDRRASDEDYIKVARHEGQPEFFTSVLLSLYHAIGDGEFDLVTDDIERLTGQRPKDFESYLRSR